MTGEAQPMSPARRMGLHSFTAQDLAAAARDPICRMLARLLEKDRLKSKCGAKTRAGGRCDAPPVTPWASRCRLHGGMSTGPKTAEGRCRIAEAQRLRWAKWQGRQGLTLGEFANSAETKG